MQTEAQQAAMQDRVLVMKDRINALDAELGTLLLDTPDLTEAERAALSEASDLLDKADNVLGMAFT
jgi:hypothetical protein